MLTMNAATSPPRLPCSACSLKTHLADPRQQAMYAVVHGGLSLELRQQSIDYLASLPFDGMAVGGSLGKNRCAGCAVPHCFAGVQMQLELPVAARGRSVSHWLVAHPLCYLPLPPADPSLPPSPPTCREDLFWLLERIMPRLHERTGGSRPVHILGIADPNSIPQVRGLPLVSLTCCLGVLLLFSACRLSTSAAAAAVAALQGPPSALSPCSVCPCPCSLLAACSW